MTLIGVCRSLVPVVLVAAACSDPGGPGTRTTIDELPRQLTAAEQKLVAGSNAFAFDLIREINKGEPGKNVFVSPLSASVALGMTAPGTGPTLEHAIEPVLALLLYATFLQVPFTAVTRSFRDGRFLAAVLGVTESAVSHQLRGLRALKLVDSERSGKMVYHRIADDHVRVMIEMASEHAQEASPA